MLDPCQAPRLDFTHCSCHQKYGKLFSSNLGRSDSTAMHGTSWRVSDTSSCPRGGPALEKVCLEGPGGFPGVRPLRRLEKIRQSWRWTGFQSVRAAGGLPRALCPGLLKWAFFPWQDCSWLLHLCVSVFPFGLIATLLISPSEVFSVPEGNFFRLESRTANFLSTCFSDTRSSKEAQPDPVLP